MTGQQGERRSEAGSPAISEWIVAAFSALLVLGVIGFLVRDAMSDPSTPRIAFEVDSITAAGDRFLVEFRATNTGLTVTNLLVEGTVHRGADTIDAAEATIDRLPTGGSRRGGLYFSQDPRLFRLEIHPKGYDVP